MEKKKGGRLDVISAWKLQNSRGIWDAGKGGCGRRGELTRIRGGRRANTWQKPPIYGTERKVSLVKRPGTLEREGRKRRRESDRISGAAEVKGGTRSSGRKIDMRST